MRIAILNHHTAGVLTPAVWLLQFQILDYCTIRSIPNTRACWAKAG